MYLTNLIEAAYQELTTLLQPGIIRDFKMEEPSFYRDEGAGPSLFLKFRFSLTDGRHGTFSYGLHSGSVDSLQLWWPAK